MPKFLSIGKKQIAILITMLILATAALWYYLGYIPKNEQALDEQHFRWLQKIDNNLRDKIVANDTLLANLLKAYSENTSKSNFENYIKNYSVQNATLSAYTTPLKTDGNILGKKYGLAKDSIQTINSRPDTSGLLFSLDWDSLRNELLLSASKEMPQTGQQYYVLMKCDFEKFITPLLTQGLFEHYVLFYEGNYMYEDFHSGLGYNVKDEDSLLKTGKAMTGSNIINQKVGGVNYQIFLQPVNFNGKKLIIAGLLSQQKIDAGKKQLPPGIVVLAVTIALGILLFLPWIKLHFQGKYDKINLRDAAESVLVAKLLISLIVLLFFTYNYSFRPKTDVHSKNNLADAIDSAFNREIDSAYICLTKFDFVMKQKSMFYDVFNLGTDSVKKGDATYYSKSYINNVQPDEILKNFCSGTQYYVVNWLDSSGKVKYNWTTSKQNDIHINYKDRDYFKNISNNNTITLEKNPDDSFVLDQVISRTSGTFRTIMCKKSFLDNPSYKQNGARVITLSFTIKSLDNIIIPAGYTFAIIDNYGNVKYNSKPERNLNENLLEEFSNKEALDDALKGGFKEVFNTKYYEGDYSVLARPLEGFPYFIVLMSDNSFPASVQIETFSFTWGMVLFFLFIVALDLSVLIIASSRRSLFKKQYLVTSWLWPRKDSAYEYRIAATGNTIIIIVLITIFCFHFFHLFEYLSYLFVLIFCVPLSTIFLNTVFLYKYKEEKNKVYFNYKVRCTLWSIVLLIILNIFAIASLGFLTYLRVLGFEIIMLLIGWLLIRYYKSTANKNQQNPPQKKAFVNSYTFMIFTRLLITSAIPAIFFYTASYSFENNLLGRYILYDYAMQLKQKFPGKVPPDLNYSKAIYTDGAWVKNIDTVKNCGSYDSGIKNNTLSLSQKNTSRLFNSFGFYLEDVSSVNNNNFSLSSSYDKNLCFNNFFDNVLYNGGGNKLCINKGITEKNHLQISSGDLNYCFPSLLPQSGKPESGLIFWLLLAAAMLGFGFIISRVIKKVCSLDLEKIPLWKGMGKMIEQLLTKTDHPLVWITGLPINEISKYVKTEIGLSNETISLDFDDIPIDDKNAAWNEKISIAKNSRRNFIIMLNIENRLSNTKITEEKFECIKTMLNNRKKVIIISGMYPLKLYEMMNRKTDAGKSIQDGIIAYMINTVLKNSDVITLPLIEKKYDEETRALYMFLNEETKYTEFLKGLRTVLLLQSIETETKKYQEDRLTLKIQSLANNFYMGIWRSLSSDEKFILHDLAADGLVNITNVFSVGLLMNKGLILEKNGHLYIFNRSFRNFIVSSVDDKEIAHMQMLQSKHSNWSNLQAPLLLIVLGVFVFLAIAQEGLYSKVIGIISGMAAGIPALLKILSMVGVQNGKEVKTEQPEE